MKIKYAALGLLAATGIALATGAHALDDGFADGLASDARPSEDRERDASRKPAQVLEFLGVESGMTALDVIAAGGWYTEVLSHAVGPAGRVIAQNAPRIAQMRGGQALRSLQARAERLGNVEVLVADLAPAPAGGGAMGAMGMAGAMMGAAPAGDAPSFELGNIDDYAGVADFAITALNMHDMYNRGAEAAVATLEGVYKVLKPGAVLGVIDHVGIAGQDNAGFHRIEREQLRDAITAAGFEIEGESDILANPDDPHTVPIRDESVTGNTDRMLIKARKPG